MEASGLVHDLGDPRREVRYGAGKALVEMSAADPEAVYPFFDAIAERLRGRDKIIRWNATRVLANLSAADRGRRIDGVLEVFLEPLRGPELVAAANVLGSMARITAARPDLAPRLSEAAVGVRRSRFRTPECRLVVIGHALRALGVMLPFAGDTGPVEEFARSQLRARRPHVRAAARAVLKSLDARMAAHAAREAPCEHNPRAEMGWRPAGGRPSSRGHDGQPHCPPL